MVEKAQLKGGGSAACVKDIVRAMSVVDSMAEIAEALKILLYLQKQDKIRIVRVKERFLEAPSGGGWRGNTCLVNECKKSDAKERRGSLRGCRRLCRLNACASEDIDSKSLQLITNHHCK